MLVDPVGTGIRQCLYSLEVGSKALYVVNIYGVELGLRDDIVQFVHVVWTLSIRVVRRYQSAAVGSFLCFLCRSTLAEAL